MNWGPQKQVLIEQEKQMHHLVHITSKMSIKIFMNLQVEGHIRAAFLEMSGMTKVDGMDLFKKITVLL